MNFLPTEVKKAMGIGRKPADPNRSVVRQELDELLLSDDIEIISTFELNHFAVLTHHDTSQGLTKGAETVEQITEIIDEIITAPADHSPLCLTKTLVLTKHVLIYGSEQVMTSFLFFGKDVEKLKTYNSVLLQQQKKGVDKFILRIKGGDVDRGEPVRVEAEMVHKLLTQPDYLRQVRDKSADPNSLVPVGSHTQAGFVSDDARLYYLKRRMEQEKNARPKSNLTKSESSFGAGYNSQDGKAVVGAAHGMEEMLKMQQKANLRFSDSGSVKIRAQEAVGYGDDEDDIVSVGDDHPNASVDLLDLDTPVPAPAQDKDIDLLGVSTQSTASQSQKHPNAPPAWLSKCAPEADLLGVTAYPPPPTAMPPPPEPDLLGSESHTGADFMMGQSAPVTDLFGSAENEAPLNPTTKSAIDLLGNMTLQSVSTGESSATAVDPFGEEEAKVDYAPMQPNNSFTPSVQHVPSTMKAPNNEDRFSAFDALSEPVAPPPAAAPPPPVPVDEGPLHFESGSIQVSGTGTWGSSDNDIGDDNDDSENGFATMGGSIGTGLVPMAGPPMDAPPPPPSEPPPPPPGGDDPFGRM